MPKHTGLTMMKSKTNILLLLTLLGTLGYVIYTHQEIGKERELRLELAEDGQVLAAKLTAYAGLATADSLFHAGSYAPARAAYEDLLSSDSLSALTADLPERINHTRQLERWRYQLDTLRLQAARSVPVPAAVLPPPPAAPLPVSPPALKTSEYDSLTMLLRQAEGQVKQLRANARKTTGPNYLTFTSGEGNDTYYVGEIRSGKANGKGVALLSTGSRYEGEWKDNKKHGEGEFYWSDGAHYQGAYVKDKRSGQGTYYFPDGSVYIGAWKNGLRDGEGVFRNAKGKVVAEGTWRKDELIK